MCHLHGELPGMTVRVTSAGTECICCTKNKHSPNAFSPDLLSIDLVRLHHITSHASSNRI